MAALMPLIMLAALILGGCGGPPKVRTTFLRGVDLVDMTDRMAQSFAEDDVIGRRTPESEPWIISVYRVVNHTNQIMREPERWAYIGRLRAQLAQSELSEARSIVWIIPPERWPIVAEELGVPDEPYGLRMDPTHLLTAEFFSLTNTSGQGRSDAYVCSFQLLALDTGTIVWEDSWEVKRAVEGVTYD